MTQKELLGKSSEEWDLLDDAQLESWAKTYFTVTRPEEAKVAREVKTGRTPSFSGFDAIALAKKLASERGLKV